MALSIKNQKADRLARQLARRTGVSLTAAVTRALEERLQGLPRRKPRGRFADVLDEIAKECGARPVLDNRSAEESLGYDENGLPR